MRKGFPTHCFRWVGYNIRGYSRSLSGPDPEPGSIGLTSLSVCSFVFFLFFFFLSQQTSVDSWFCWSKLQLDEFLGKTSYQILKKEKRKMGSCSKWTFFGIGWDNIGNECSIMQVCPSEFLHHYHHQLCSSYKRCVLEVAISRQASIIFHWVKLIYWLCTSSFSWTSTLLETRKTEKCCLSDTVGNTAYIHNVSIQFFWQDTLTQQ